MFKYLKMGLNIITIDINTEREDPIRINKPTEMQPQSEVGYDEMMKKDIKDITLTSLYMASMLSEEDELTILNNIENMIKNRKNEIN